MIDLISGIPACGKTSYGDYLRDKKDYQHLDMESFQGSWHHRLWEIACQTNDLKFFTESLAREGRPVALSWGFPPSNLNLVTELQKFGVVIWWFDGDEAAAREAFIERGVGDVVDFDDQLKKIKESWTQIEQTIGQRKILTLEESGKRKSFEEIWSEMTLKR